MTIEGGIVLCPHCRKPAAEHTPAESMEHIAIYLAHSDTTVKKALLFVMGTISSLYAEVQARPANPSSKRMVIGALASLAHVIQDAMRRIDDE